MKDAMDAALMKRKQKMLGKGPQVTIVIGEAEFENKEKNGMMEQEKNDDKEAGLAPEVKDIPEERKAYEPSIEGKEDEELGESDNEMLAALSSMKRETPVRKANSLNEMASMVAEKEMQKMKMKKTKG